jgi:hypothetical protein
MEMICRERWLRHYGKIVPYPMPMPVVKAATEEAHRVRV